MKTIIQILEKVKLGFLGSNQKRQKERFENVFSKRFCKLMVSKLIKHIGLILKSISTLIIDNGKRHYAAK